MYIYENYILKCRRNGRATRQAQGRISTAARGRGRDQGAARAIVPASVNGTPHTKWRDKTCLVRQVRLAAIEARRGGMLARELSALSACRAHLYGIAYATALEDLAQVRCDSPLRDRSELDASSTRARSELEASSKRVVASYLRAVASWINSSRSEAERSEASRERG